MLSSKPRGEYQVIKGPVRETLSGHHDTGTVTTCYTHACYICVWVYGSRGNICRDVVCPVSRRNPRRVGLGAEFIQSPVQAAVIRVE